MRLNELKPAKGAKQSAKRVGRGPGSGIGKTAGRGHKGQKSRSGGFHKTGFEGGQMPLQRRVPKVGFHSAKSAETAELRLDALNKLGDAEVDLAALKKARLVSGNIKRVKIILAGELKAKSVIKDKNVKASKGAAKAIEAAGGNIQS